MTNHCTPSPVISSRLPHPHTRDEDQGPKHHTRTSSTPPMIHTDQERRADKATTKNHAHTHSLTHTSHRDTKGRNREWRVLGWMQICRILRYDVRGSLHTDTAIDEKETKSGRGGEGEREREKEGAEAAARAAWPVSLIVFSTLQAACHLTRQRRPPSGRGV
jgi:hypothetical protein